ncbi:hypothetical protein BMR1_03g02465 [Babesia microti strain RI]|uniref:Uncharacterized protein n=1 Tax=Babesia microti (strain RI) TaxID=1133968 RepID=A0A0K3AR27_BABMR|nr:hypothetical protein BMR1_03g02465 [Babesia microti strain RI]CTQ41093.1 hypothetical protein BMR1_03g02465 [Babesia microti strain RI]|eukprot:XP_012649104.1 hypothetical protein BMR1_03g02465 [Babesia microti strain RI]
MSVNNNNFYDIELGSVEDEIKRLKIEDKIFGQKHYPAESDYILAKNSAISEHVNLLEIQNGPVKWEGRIITITKKATKYSIMLHIITFIVSVSMTFGIVYMFLLYNNTQAQGHE